MCYYKNVSPLMKKGGNYMNVELFIVLADIAIKLAFITYLTKAIFD